MNVVADQYREEALQMTQTHNNIEYLSYFKKLKHKNIAKLFEKAAAEYTVSNTSSAAAESYYSAAYNFMLANVLDKSAQCYILAAKMYGPCDDDKSITAYLYAVDIYEKMHRCDMCIKCYDNVAELYLHRNRGKEAIHFYEMCIQTAGKEGYSSVHYQEKIASIQTTHFGYYAIAITVYDSIIQKLANEPIVYPFLMISIMLRILVNNDMDNIEKYIGDCLGIGGFSKTEYYKFIQDILANFKSGESRFKIQEKMQYYQLIYKEKDEVFNNVVITFLISQIIQIV